MDNHGTIPDTECVEITGIGMFSRAQIEAMLYLTTVKDQCEQGLAFCKWLMEDVVSVVRSTLHPMLQEMADQVEHSNPQDIIRIEGHDYHYAMLFRMKPPSWANDALILAFCARLCATNSTTHVHGIENAVTGRKTKTITEAIKAKAQIMESGVETLFIPVNFGNTHWCGIIVNVKGKQVMYYDPMNQKSYKSVLDRLSWDLAETLSDVYQVVAINSPIQTDGHKCGFYVMLRFWRYVDASLSLDLTQTGLTLLRFRILQFLLKGSISN